MANGVIPLDDEEADLIDLLESDATELRSIRTDELDAAIRRAAAHRIDRASEPVALEIPKQDLDRLKAMAEARGISYETLINGLIRAYIAG